MSRCLWLRGIRWRAAENGVRGLHESGGDLGCDQGLGGSVKLSSTVNLIQRHRPHMRTSLPRPLLNIASLFPPSTPRLRADSMPAIMDVRPTLGAVFIGCLFSVAYVEPPPVFLLAPPDLASSSRKSLSAVLGIQTFMFFRMYPHDLPRIKLMVRPPTRTSPMFET